MPLTLPSLTNNFALPTGSRSSSLKRIATLTIVLPCGPGLNEACKQINFRLYRFYVRIRVTIAALLVIIIGAYHKVKVRDSICIYLFEIQAQITKDSGCSYLKCILTLNDVQSPVLGVETVCDRINLIIDE